MTDISPQEEGQPIWKEQARKSSDAHTSRITDSLITALRDPAKPILCFLSSNLPQEVRNFCHFSVNFRQIRQDCSSSLDLNYKSRREDFING